jgi:hypothetical protein
MVNRESKPRGEEYVRGRKAGVEGTYGESRGMKGAEKTIFPGDDNDGGGEDGLGEAASSLYQRAVKNEGGGGGDPALTER